MTSLAESETAFALHLLKHDYWTKGWPDFLVYNSEQHFIMGVEVKQGYDKLSVDQQVVHSLLEAGGIPVITFIPDLKSDVRIQDQLKRQMLKKYDDYFHRRHHSTRMNKVKVEQV